MTDLNPLPVTSELHLQWEPSEEHEQLLSSLLEKQGV